jgi:hypothetical protein
MLLSRISCVFACVALINKGDLDCFAGLLLRAFRKSRDLGAVLFIGGCHAQGKQMPERVYSQMDLTAFPAFGAVIACAPSTLGRRLQGPAIKDCGGRAFSASCCDPQDSAQVMGKRLEDASFDPALRLLIDDAPGRQVMWRPSPLRSGSNDIAQAVGLRQKTITAPIADCFQIYLHSFVVIAAGGRWRSRG